MSNDIINKIIDDLMPIFQATDQALNEWKGEGNLQFPRLLETMAIKLNWDDKQLREADPLVRMYVRRHPDWYVTRGAHGGIMKTTDKQKKEQAKLNKDLLKKQMADAIEAKSAKTASQVNDVDSDDSEKTFVI